MKSFLISVAAIFSLTALLIFGIAPGFVSADEYSQGGKAMEKESMSMGNHDMSGTIEGINHKTGWIKLKTGMGEMTIHYPPQAISDLKKGDKITAHLSYSKEEEAMKEEEKMKGGMMKK